MNIVYIVIAIIFWIICGIMNCVIRSEKGYNHGFIWGFLFGIFALVFSAALPDLNMIKKINKLENELAILKRASNQSPNSAESINNSPDNSNVNNVKKAVKKDVKKTTKTIQCPQCNRVQLADRTHCWQCGAKLHEDNY